MKRIILLLCLCILLGLAGCAGNVDQPEVPVRFFYPRHTNDILYEGDDGVVTWELRESAGNEENYSYLLNLYLRGPTVLPLRNPFPRATSVVSFEQNANQVILTLSDPFAQLSGMDLTLAGACLMKTVNGMTGAEILYIRTQTQSLDSSGYLLFRMEDLIFTDSTNTPDTDQKGNTT